MPSCARLRYASLGERERKELHALAAAWLTSMGEDSATVAGQYDLGGQHARAAEHWARAAQRALRRQRPRRRHDHGRARVDVRRRQARGFFARLVLGRGVEPARSASERSRISYFSMEDNVYDEPSAVRARGARARYDDARGSGEGISERLAETRDQAAALGLLDEEARCSAVLALRVAFAGRFAEAEAEIKRLLKLAQQQTTSAAAVDAYQTQAIVRQTQGSLATALEARRNAASAARGAGLKEREAMLMTNLGFALTTIGARQEARTALETGLALSDAIGSLGAVRHAQMNLLGWAATFGNDRHLEAHLAEVRADADAAATGVWAAPDRANLGMLFYRGSELLRASAEREWRRALGLLRIAAQSYRTTGHRDLLPVALGLWRRPSAAVVIRRARSNSRVKLRTCSTRARRAY